MTIIERSVPRIERDFVISVVILSSCCGNEFFAQGVIIISELEVTFMITPFRSIAQFKFPAIFYCKFVRINTIFHLCVINNLIVGIILSVRLFRYAVRC